MIKNLQKVMAITIMVIVLMSTMCFATDVETTSAEEQKTEEVLTAEDQTDGEGNAVLTTGNDVESDAGSSDVAAEGSPTTPDMELDDVYLIEDNVDYNRIVDGNAYIIGKDIKVSSVIGGDMFIIGENVTLTEECVIYGNLFLLAKTATLDCYVYGGNLYAACSDLTVGESGAIYRDMKVAATNFKFNGAVGRNAYVYANQIEIGESTKMYGDFNYTAPEAAQVPSGAVTGTINYTELVETGSESASVSPVLLIVESLAFSFIYTLCVFGLIVLFARNFLNRVQSSKPSNVLMTCLKGLAVLVGAPITAVVLMITLVGIPVSLALLALWALLVFGFSSVVATISIAGMISTKVPAFAKAHGLLGVILVTIALFAVELIPYIGGIVNLLTCVYGLGLIISGSFVKKEGKSTEE